MDQSDLAFIQRKEAATSPERAKIPFEVMNTLQSGELAIAMSPQRIKEQIIPGQTNIIEGLVERYFEKYVIAWNGIQAYCEYEKADLNVLRRLQMGTYTDEDLLVLGTYMESSGPDRAFFKNDTEIDDFLRQYVH